jgi:putative lipoic acid-binding regulatory protein
MGHNTDAFENAVRAILDRHLCGARSDFAKRPSSNGKYLSLTATFTATSREQLDALYRELNALELVVMTL